MCGIAGTTGADAERRTAAMLPLLRHRGPDDEGIYADNAARVAIGATRLSIIDVAGGHQPITNEDGSVHCVLNGEIYNFRSLRERLMATRHQYSNKDRHGNSRAPVRGIWQRARTRARWHVRLCSLGLPLRNAAAGRDRLGEKPLSHEAHGSLTFASELTALRRGTEFAPDLDPGRSTSSSRSATSRARRQSLQASTAATRDNRRVAPGPALKQTQYWSLPSTRRLQETPVWPCRGNGLAGGARRREPDGRRCAAWRFS